MLAVNNTNITNFSHGDIVNMIKDSGSTVTLTIGPPNGNFFFIIMRHSLIIHLYTYVFSDDASTVSLPMSNRV